jgi:hypothetical protein
MSRRCNETDCRKWAFSGTKNCLSHKDLVLKRSSKSLTDAIEIEKLEIQEKHGEVTAKQVTQRQRESLVSSLPGPMLDGNAPTDVTKGAEKPSTMEAKDAGNGGRLAEDQEAGELIAASAVAADGLTYKLGDLDPETTILAVKQKLATLSEMNTSSQIMYLVEDTRGDELGELKNHQTVREVSKYSTEGPAELQFAVVLHEKVKPPANCPLWVKISKISGSRYAELQYPSGRWYRNYETHWTFEQFLQSEVFPEMDTGALQLVEYDENGHFKNVTIIDDLNEEISVGIKLCNISHAFHDAQYDARIHVAPSAI